MWMQSRYDHEVEPWETKDESFKITVDGFEDPLKPQNPKLEKKNMNKKH
jgi:hypothetical protein